ncbi:MAG: PEP-CTERM sorting domain-containing protein [Verrucomicrobiota bacterium]|nr:PEP-CTERM sorting domain-containing protein [Limisphaera sp.]MDW8383062.1 PEP-CTERM sorting domain-containing protein [Verrucomicrobiota bacterium]
MKTLRLLCTASAWAAVWLCNPLSVSAQSAVVDPSYSWVGYMNVYNLVGGNSAGSYLWGSPWGVADLPAAWIGTELRLAPNTSTWNPSDPYWVNNGQPNKWLEANFYVDMGTAWGGQTVTFSGSTLENSLVAPYNAVAFVKEFTPGYGWVGMNTQTLQSGTAFSVSRAIGAGNIAQFGFMVTGPNADPATVAGLGQVRIAVIPESGTLALMGLGWVALGLRCLRRDAASRC